MKVKEDLNISRDDLHKVADFLPYPFIIAEVFDGMHQNTHLNEKFSEEIGYTLEQIPTIEAWYEHAYPDSQYRHTVITNWDQEEINSRKEGKVFVRMKSQVTCRNGVKRWYEVKATVINAVHVVAFVDLDKEIILQEKMKSINQNNDRMLSILGHDLRAPIANLMSISSMAVNTQISNIEFTDLIHMVNDQSAQVMDLLENTLSWAKLNFNAIELKPVTIDIENLINTVLALYKNAILDKNIAVQIDNDLKAVIYTDVEILTVIIRNLLSNAIKFTPKNGHIIIKSNAGQLTIQDNGIGMSKKMVDAILNKNFSSRKGTNNEHGTGLGLQLVVSLAEKIEVRLEIESAELEGTTMRLIF